MALDGRTHADGCWDWGPKHYDCALRRIAELERDLVTETRLWTQAETTIDKAQIKLTDTCDALKAAEAERDKIHAEAHGLVQAVQGLCFFKERAEAERDRLREALVLARQTILDEEKQKEAHDGGD